MAADIQAHCTQINRCNQRGGRMLSVVDLIEGGTLTRDMAAFSLAAIGSGASFMVGALPGGAGKTTVMGALLNFVPTEVQLVPADGIEAIDRGLREPSPRCCFICHEIGAGPYYAYLWGASLRRYFELPAADHMIATNLHADTYEQAHEQVCGENEVPVRGFRRMNVMYFLAVDTRGWNGQRRITAVWESDGETEHRQVFGSEPGRLSRASTIVSADGFDAASQTINMIMAAGGRTIEQVRTVLMEGKTWTRSR